MRWGKWISTINGFVGRDRWKALVDGKARKKEKQILLRERADPLLIRGWKPKQIVWRLLDCENAKISVGEVQDRKKELTQQGLIQAGKLKRFAQMLGRNWLKILLFIFASSFIAAYTITHYPPLKIGDKYTIFVDLVLIILALMGAIGYVVFQWVYGGVENRVKSAIEEGHNYARVQDGLTVGYVFYVQYEAESKRKKEIEEVRKKVNKISLQRHRKDSKVEGAPDTDDFMKYLNDAIEKTMNALETTKQLDEKKYEEIICVCKNNIAYYLAERQKQQRARPGDGRLARSFADYIKKRIEKYPKHRAAWNHTCNFVQEQFPDND